MKKSLIRRILFTLALFVFAIGIGRVDVQAKAIYTGNKKIDTAVVAVVNRCTKEGMTQEEKLKACYLYLVKNMKYTHGSRSVQIKPTAAEKKLYAEELSALKASGDIEYNKKFKKDYKHLLTMSGTCKHMSGVMCIIANHLGYKAGYCTGTYVRKNGSTTEHWWNYITVNGKKKYCDVQAANCNYKRTHKTKTAINTYYLKSKGSKVWKKHHRG